MSSKWKKLQCFWRAINITWYQFATRTSVHGIKFLCDTNDVLFTKILWLSVLVGCFFMSSTLTAAFWFRYQSNPTRMNVETNFGPVAQVPYPAVTFCSTNFISLKKSRNFVTGLKFPRNITAESIIPYLEQAIGFSHRTEYNALELETIQEVLDFNRYDTSTAMRQLKIACSDLIVKCRFEGKFMNCSELFRRTGTYNGYCCSFNLADFDKIDFDPIRPKYFGIANGLSVILQPNIDSDSVSKIHSDGIQLLIHDSGTFPSDTSIEKMLPFKSETVVSLRPTVTFCSAQVKQLSVKARQCVFPDEIQLEHFKSYKEINCDVECRIKKTMIRCECIPYYYPNIYQFPVCNFSKIPCLLDHYYELHESHENRTTSISCECPASCSGINYDVHTDTAPIIISNYTYDTFYNGVNASHMIVHIFMDSQVYKRMRRDLLVNIVGLISNIGGGYSLFLGMSVIGVVEIFYFAIVRLYKNYKDLRRREKSKKKKKRRTNKKITKLKLEEIVAHM